MALLCPSACNCGTQNSPDSEPAAGVRSAEQLGLQAVTSPSKRVAAGLGNPSPQSQQQERTAEAGSLCLWNPESSSLSASSGGAALCASLAGCPQAQQCVERSLWNMVRQLFRLAAAQDAPSAAVESVQALAATAPPFGTVVVEDKSTYNVLVAVVVLAATGLCSIIVLLLMLLIARRR